jgi:hypothetical protein
MKTRSEWMLALIEDTVRAYALIIDDRTNGTDRCARLHRVYAGFSASLLSSAHCVLETYHLPNAGISPFCRDR